MTIAGLYDKWQSDDIAGAKWLQRYMRVATDDTEVFQAPLFIVYGWIAGFIVLMFEVNWRKIIQLWTKRY